VSKYQVNQKIVGLSRLYQHGKTHVPSEVRKLLNVKDGERLVYILEAGKIFLGSA